MNCEVSALAHAFWWLPALSPCRSLPWSLPKDGSCSGNSTWLRGAYDVSSAPLLFLQSTAHSAFSLDQLQFMLKQFQGTMQHRAMILQDLLIILRRGSSHYKAHIVICAWVSFCGSYKVQCAGKVKSLTNLDSW